MRKIKDIERASVSKETDRALALTTRAITFVVITLACSSSIRTSRAEDFAAGETSFKKCAFCHAVGEGAKNKVGPALNGLAGRRAGTMPNFAYSQANKKVGILWSEADFVDYIKDPKAKIPGTKKVFLGIKDETEAKALWAYLGQFQPDGTRR
jgi:cytochrome c